MWFTGPNRKAKLSDEERVDVSQSGSRQLLSFNNTCWCSRGCACKYETYLVITKKLPTVKNTQNFLALNNKNGMYSDERMKQERPEPRHTAKQISLCVADNLILNLLRKLGPLVVESSLISDLNEYCELNIADCRHWFLLRSIRGKLVINLKSCLLFSLHPICQKNSARSARQSEYDFCKSARERTRKLGK